MPGGLPHACSPWFMQQSEVLEGEAGEAHGRSEAGKPLNPHSEDFRPARLWGCQDNMFPQASYS